MRLMLIALPLMLLLSGCVSAPVAVECPELETLPESVVDALSEAAREHRDAARWVVDLERHYVKLETCS